MLDEIEYALSMTNGIGEFDQEASNDALQTLEEDLLFDLERWNTKLEKRGDKATDWQKKQQLTALASYNLVSQELGENSPAKVAARALANAAAAEAALRALSANIASATDLAEVMDEVRFASKGTSPLPDMLEGARTSDEVRSVLRIVAQDAKLARALAKGVLAATNADEVSKAFNDIAFLAATSGVQDPEVILKAKLDSIVTGLVSKAGF